MKINFLPSVVLPLLLLFPCCKEDNSIKTDSSLLIGKWEISAIEYTVVTNDDNASALIKKELESYVNPPAKEYIKFETNGVYEATETNGLYETTTRDGKYTIQDSVLSYDSGQSNMFKVSKSQLNITFNFPKPDWINVTFLRGIGVKNPESTQITKIEGIKVYLKVK